MPMNQEFKNFYKQNSKSTKVKPRNLMPSNIYETTVISCIIILCYKPSYPAYLVTGLNFIVDHYSQNQNDRGIPHNSDNNKLQSCFTNPVSGPTLFTMLKTTMTRVIVAALLLYAYVCSCSIIATLVYKVLCLNAYCMQI